MSVDGNNRKIPEDEVRVKRFLIQEIKNHPSMWGRQGCGVAGRPAGGRSLSEDWKAILINIQEAFKNDPELLAKYKVDTLPRLRKTWSSLQECHRRKWSGEIENDSKGKYSRYRIYGLRWDQPKIDHISNMTIYQMLV